MRPVAGITDTDLANVLLYLANPNGRAAAVVVAAVVVAVRLDHRCRQDRSSRRVARRCLRPGLSIPIRRVMAPTAATAGTCRTRRRRTCRPLATCPSTA